MTGHRVLDIATKPALLTVDQGGYRTVIKCECGRVFVLSGETIEESEQRADMTYGGHVQAITAADRAAVRAFRFDHIGRG